MHFSLLLILGVAQYGLANEQAEPVDPGQWLQEVTYLITDSERQEFLTFQMDSERRKFIQRFWKRRDPEPATERSEAKEEHYRRLEYANQHFSHGKPGWKTERGRIYIIHGEPDERIPYAGATVSIPLREQAAPGGPHAVNIEAPDMEFWTYQNLVGLDNLRGTVTLVFARVSLSDVNKLLSLGRSQSGSISPENIPFGSSAASPLPQGITGGHDFQLLYAGPSRFVNPAGFYSAFYHGIRGDSLEINRADLVGNIAEMQKPAGDRIERYERERQAVREAVQTGVFFDVIEARIAHWVFYSADGQTYLPIAVHIPGSGLNSSREIALLAELSRNEQVVAHFFDTLNLATIDGARLRFEGMTYQGRLAARPGDYMLDIYLLDRGGERYNHLQTPVTLPSLDAQAAPVLSELVLCRNAMDGRQARELLAEHNREWLTYSDYNPLKIDQFLLRPAVTNRFRRKDRMTLFFEIYRPGLRDERPEIEARYEIRSSAGQLLRETQNQLNYLTGDDLTKTSHAVSFDLRNFEPGSYQMVLSIRDRALNQSRSRSHSFVIE